MSAAEPAVSSRAPGPGPAGRGERTTGAYNRRSMQRFLLERRIRDVHTRLVRAREELAVLDEQLAVVADEAEEARLRSLVSETPLAAHEYAEVKRHADAITRAREAMGTAVDDLQHRQDELLTHVGTGR
jgi:hypothetical protein